MSGAVGNPPKAVRSVQWAPNLERHFVQWSHAPGGKAAGSDLTLYECSEKSSGSASVCKPTIRAINKDFESVLVTCFRWCPSPASPYHFAAGVSTGQVVISSFQPIAGGPPPAGDTPPLSAKPMVLVKGGSNQRAITQRQCKCISWNATQDNLLLAGLAVLARARSDPCVQVWDILHQTPPSEPQEQQPPSQDPESALAEPPLTSFSVLSNPYHGFVKDETCTAVEWVPRSAQSFAAGFQKGLRLFDLRENKNLGVVAQAKAAVSLLAFDPGFENRLATFSGERDDTSIKIWDLRWLANPVMQVQASGTPKRIQWCPGVDGVLSAVVAGGGDEGILQLWGVRSNEDHRECYSAQETEEPRPQAGKPDVKGRGGGTTAPATSDALWTRKVEAVEDIASFDWHPLQEGRVLTVSSEDAMRDVKLSFYSALSFSPHGALALASDSTLFQSAEGSKDDIAEVMRERAMKGYVLEPQVNMEICRTMGSHDLAKVWQIVQRLQQGKGDAAGGEQPEERVVGLADMLSSSTSQKVYKPLLPMMQRSISRDRLGAQAAGSEGAAGGMQRSASGSKQRRSSLPEEPGKDVESDSLVLEVFVSEQRRHALKVCDFDFGDKDAFDDDRDYKGSEALEQKVTSMQRKGQYDQAAFIRILQVDLSSSLECLYKGASHNPDGGGMYAMAAVALAGAANQALPVWRRAYQHMMEVCKEPYLRACFLILNRDLDGVMKEEGLALMDRVAFACRFMPDPHLTSAFKQLLASKVKRGQLDAILLLGLGPPSIPLLENYVAATSDLQTAALLLCFFTSAPPQAASSSKSAAAAATTTPSWERWLEEYREVLDRLELWEHRAILDIALTPTLRPAPPAEVHVVCTSCGAPATLGLSAGEQTKAAGEVKSGPSQCKSCSAELPRCCLCLMPMGCNNTPPTADVSLPPILSLRPHDAGGVSSDDVVRPLYSRSHFDSWFAWCQQCHHGGHVGHLQHWFASNSICPVTGCKCLCLSHDSYLPRTSIAAGPKPTR